MTDGDTASVCCGFEEFRTWSQDDVAEGLRSGLVAIDTNVLLDLYRYDPDVRAEMIDVLTKLEDRLFVPHQVASEFWRNREAALTDRVRTARTLTELLDTRAQEVESAVNRWRRRSGGAIDQTIDDLVATASAAIEQIANAIEVAAALTTHDRDTFNDEVLGSIERLTAGRVGKAPSDEQRAAWVAEGRRRVQEKIPPGYRDSSKEGDGASGDFLVWAQTLAEAQRRSFDRIIFVTSDQKEDWIRIDGGERRGARLELRREALDQAGADLAILSSSGLLATAENALDVDVSDAAVSQLSAFTGASDRDWDGDNVREFLGLLVVEDSCRHNVLSTAIANGGRVQRDEVYEICDFAADRTLRGFTRPTSRIKRELVRRGHLSEYAEEPLTAEYLAPDSYVLASGFRVPQSFLSAAEDASGPAPVAD